jgi:hypothetical protein
MVFSNRRRSAMTAAIAGLALATTPAPAGAARVSRKTTPACGHAKSRLLLADHQAEIYEAPTFVLSPEALGIYGCAYRTGRQRELGGPPAQAAEGGPEKESGVLDPTLTGTVVAYAKSYYSPYGLTRNLVVVRDLRTGRLLHEVPDGTPVKPEPGSEGLGPVDAIVVKSDGAVAWIVRTDPEEGMYQVHALDQTGSRVLSTGSDIAPNSLALAGSTLYWTQGGEPHSATLN